MCRKILFGNIRTFELSPCARAIDKCLVCCRVIASTDSIERINQLSHCNHASINEKESKNLQSLLIEIRSLNAIQYCLLVALISTWKGNKIIICQQIGELFSSVPQGKINSIENNTIKRGAKRNCWKKSVYKQLKWSYLWNLRIKRDTHSIKVAMHLIHKSTSQDEHNSKYVVGWVCNCFKVVCCCFLSFWKTKYNYKKFFRCEREKKTRKKWEEPISVIWSSTFDVAHTVFQKVETMSLSISLSNSCDAIRNK